MSEPRDVIEIGTPRHAKVKDRGGKIFEIIITVKVMAAGSMVSVEFTEDDTKSFAIVTRTRETAINDGLNELRNNGFEILCSVSEMPR